MSSVWSFAFLWCFESLAAGAPTEEGKKEQGMQLCSRPSRTPPGFCPFYPTSTRPSPSSLGQMKADIMSEDRCQKSLNLLGSNDLKCRREYTHSMPKRHRHRMSKKWSITTAVIKLELMTQRQN